MAVDDSGAQSCTVVKIRKPGGKEYMALDPTVEN